MLIQWETSSRCGRLRSRMKANKLTMSAHRSARNTSYPDEECVSSSLRLDCLNAAGAPLSLKVFFIFFNNMAAMCSSLQNFATSTLFR